MNMRRYVLISACAIACMLYLSGCDTSTLDFEAESVVNEDGSIQRTTVFKADTNVEKEEVLTCYKLPRGGVWTTAPMVAYDEKTKKYLPQPKPAHKARRTFVDSQLPATDYRRITASGIAHAENRFNVDVFDWWLVKWFVYEERFTDTVDVEKAMPFINMFINRLSDEFKRQLNMRLSGPEFVNDVAQELRNKYADMFKEIAKLRIKEQSGLSTLRPRAQELELVQEMFALDEVSVEWLATRFPEFDNEEWQAILAEIMSAATSSEDEALTGEGVGDALIDFVYGSHGLAIFRNYDFTIHVMMPGDIVEANTTNVSGNRLTWEFDYHELNRLLTARSVKLYLDKMIAFFFFILVLYGYSVYESKRRIKTATA